MSTKFRFKSTERASQKSQHTRKLDFLKQELNQKYDVPS